LKEVLNTALSNLDTSLSESGAEIASGELPVIVGDQSQLTQVFQNLIGNAVKYAGTRSPRIKISADRDPKGTWVVSVADNGIGIQPEFQRQIFEIFKRLHHRQEYPGTGIGLAICKRVVERHHGQIWVESEPGQGSTFSFTLPDAPPDPTAEPRRT
jgi:light-regulated signal transduction histidine kinase (bacteriophytochrome)